MTDYRHIRRIVIAGSLAGLVLMLVAATIASAQGASPDGRPQWDGTLRRIRVPILMYHYVSVPPADADAVRINLSVTPDRFAAQMAYLAGQGYETVTSADVTRALLTGEQLPSRPVVLTFDDGYAEHFTTVLPLLQQYGFTGTFYIITGTADHDVPGYLTWPQISAMAQAGMEMENHTRDHFDLRGRDFDFLVYQMLGAQQSLQAYTGRDPVSFAYPAGAYDSAALDVLRTLPVWSAVTTEPGVWLTTDRLLEMPRVRVSGDTSLDSFAAMLAAP